MSNDDEANGISIDQSSVEDKGNEMVVENDGVQIEVKGDLGGGCEIWNKAVEWLVDGLFLFSLDLHDM